MKLRSFRKGTRLAKVKTIRFVMPRHTNALRALAVAGDVEAELLHGVFVEGEPVLALEEAVVDRVRTYLPTMITLAHAQLLLEL